MEITELQKEAIINSGKEFFRTRIIPNHIRNLQRLKLSSFNINPFLINYLAAFSLWRLRTRFACESTCVSTHTRNKS